MDEGLRGKGGIRDRTERLRILHRRDQVEGLRAEARAALEASAKVRRRFMELGSNIALRIIPLAEIIQGVFERQVAKETSVVESTDVGRLIQVLRAAGIDFGKHEASLASKTSNR